MAYILAYLSTTTEALIGASWETPLGAGFPNQHHGGGIDYSGQNRHLWGIHEPKKNGLMYRAVKLIPNNNQIPKLRQIHEHVN